MSKSRTLPTRATPTPAAKNSAASRVFAQIVPNFLANHRELLRDEFLGVGDDASDQGGNARPLRIDDFNGHGCSVW